MMVVQSPCLFINSPEIIGDFRRTSQIQVSVPFNMMFPSGIALAGGLDKTSELSVRRNYNYVENHFLFRIRYQNLRVNSLTSVIAKSMFFSIFTHCFSSSFTIWSRKPDRHPRLIYHICLTSGFPILPFKVAELWILLCVFRKPPLESRIVRVDAVSRIPLTAQYDCFFFILRQLYFTHFQYLSCAKAALVEARTA